MHGNINSYLSKYNGQNITSSILKYTLHLESYDANYIELDFRDIIFIPDNEIVDKYSYVGEGLFLNKCGLTIYPANDLFPDDGKGDIYKELDNIKNIEIFGMSPYGDQSLIKKISKIENIIIYVYNMNMEEIREWAKYIQNAIFKDSKEFITSD